MKPALPFGGIRVLSKNLSRLYFEENTEWAFTRDRTQARNFFTNDDDYGRWLHVMMFPVIEHLPPLCLDAKKWGWKHISFPGNLLCEISFLKLLYFFCVPISFLSPIKKIVNPSIRRNISLNFITMCLALIKGTQFPKLSQQDAMSFLSIQVF